MSDLCNVDRQLQQGDGQARPLLGVQQPCEAEQELEAVVHTVPGQVQAHRPPSLDTMCR